MQLHIESVPVQSLKPAAQNARIHDKRQINQLVSSIQTFGFLVPVLIDRNNTLIAGHGRVLAASALQMELVPAIRIEHLSPAQQRAYLIADNKLTENAKWDRALLAREFEGLLELDLDFSIEVTGFNTSEIDAIIDEQLHIGEDAADVPTGAVPARCQAGDLWQCGEHRVLCGDALQPESYERLLAGEQAQLVLTDPPYNVAIDGHVCGAGKIRHREFAMAAGEMSQTEFSQFLLVVFTLLRQHSGNGSLHYVFMDWRHLREILTAGHSAYDELKNLCVWVKDNAGMGSFYRSRHELALLFKHGDQPSINNIELGRYGRYRSNVWEYAGINSFAGRKAEQGNLLALHPTVKPVRMLEDAIKDASHHGGLVLDPFLGSGSTLIAAERAKRRCYGIEIDPLYVDTILKRWEDHTGGSATKLASLAELTVGGSHGS